VPDHSRVCTFYCRLRSVLILVLVCAAANPPYFTVLTLTPTHSLLVVMLSIDIPSTNSQICYFSITPAYTHYSTETPLYSPTLSPGETICDPIHPLLAYREPNSSILPASPTPRHTFLQMQTAAAHPSRPRPAPIQNVLHVTSDDSTSSEESVSSTDSTKSSLDIARCSRCQRTPSIDIKTGKSNMVQYGLNLWYCSRYIIIAGNRRT
jgi:hypothetical protein